MPEGPSIVILKQEAAAFEGETILGVEGNTTVDKQRLVNQRIVALRSWGKHFLIQLPDFALRIHFLLFGSYRINERKPDRPIRLGLRCAGGELNFYACSVRFIDEDLDKVYDWRVDVMSDRWDAVLARRKLRKMPDTWACDALLDQNLFAGVGNIIKNEVLFRIRVHPLSRIGALPPDKRDELIREARRYSFDFLEWKKAYVLKKHWLAHTKRVCPRCDIPFSKGKLGLRNRRSFWCENCQQLYADPLSQRAGAGASLHPPPSAL
jgi:endonuclease-8